MREGPSSAIVGDCADEFAIVSAACARTASAAAQRTAASASSDPSTATAIGALFVVTISPFACGFGWVHPARVDPPDCTPQGCDDTVFSRRVPIPGDAATCGRRRETSAQGADHFVEHSIQQHLALLAVRQVLDLDGTVGDLTITEHQREPRT